MLFSPEHVANIINLVISAHGSYLPDIAPVSDAIGMRIMFQVSGYELIDALNTIKVHGKCDTKTAAAALTAVRAYLDKS